MIAGADLPRPVGTPTPSTRSPTPRDSPSSALPSVRREDPPSVPALRRPPVAGDSPSPIPAPSLGDSASSAPGSCIPVASCRLSLPSIDSSTTLSGLIGAASASSEKRLSWLALVDSLPVSDFDIGSDFSVDQRQFLQDWLHLRQHQSLSEKPSQRLPLLPSESDLDTTPSLPTEKIDWLASRNSACVSGKFMPPAPTFRLQPFEHKGEFANSGVSHERIRHSFPREGNTNLKVPGFHYPNRQLLAVALKMATSPGKTGVNTWSHRQRPPLLQPMTAGGEAKQCSPVRGQCRVNWHNTGQGLVSQRCIQIAASESWFWGTSGQSQFSNEILGQVWNNIRVKQAFARSRRRPQIAQVISVQFDAPVAPQRPHSEERGENLRKRFRRRQLRIGGKFLASDLHITGNEDPFGLGQSVALLPLSANIRQRLRGTLLYFSYFQSVIQVVIPCRLQ